LRESFLKTVQNISFCLTSDFPHFQIFNTCQVMWFMKTENFGLTSKLSFKVVDFFKINFIYSYKW
jgi:hypothetical protein